MASSGWYISKCKRGILQAQYLQDQNKGQQEDNTMKLPKIPEWLINNNGLVRLMLRFPFLEDSKLFACLLEIKQKFVNEPVCKLFKR